VDEAEADAMSAGPPRLSVVIPCYNAASTLRAQMDALAAQRWDEPWEIIVADNGSTDHSRAVLEEYQTRLPQLRIVDASARRGQPYALNTGAAASRAEFLAFVDADDEVGPGWVAALGNAFVNGCDFVASRFDMERLNAPWVRETRGNGQANGLMQLWYPPFLPFAGGCGLGVRRTFHAMVGGFDEALPYVHDTDYCIKIQLTGAKLHFVPEALVHIRLRDDFRAMFRQSRLWAEANVLVYRRYQSSVSPPPSWHPWRAYGLDWLYLLRDTYEVRCRGTLGAWISRLGWQIGRFVGSVKHGVGPA
jgi:glycosyltransferase involved in cell wall biosynthesis